jgi:hypothetical protein
LAKQRITMSSTLQKRFVTLARKNLTTLKRTKGPVMQEAIARSVQDAFSKALSEENIEIATENKNEVADKLRSHIAEVGFAKKAVAGSIKTNILTSEVKDKATTDSVMRLKITLKEEGLEWVVKKSESGNIEKTLQDE